MKFFSKIKISYMVILATMVIVAVLVALFAPKKPKDNGYEPAPPEAPRLTSLGAIGQTIDFSKEVRYYEIQIPAGNPQVPMVWATAVEGINIEIYQARFTPDKNEAVASVYLDDGKYKNSYDIKFVKNESLGLVLQYDDRYNFVPDYQLKNGEKFIFKSESEGKNISVDENGVIRAVGVSDMHSTVNAYVDGKVVASLIVNRTEKAVIDMFIVAGQGNAFGEGGDALESPKTVAGTAYTVELSDMKNTMVDLSNGRQGFAPSIAEKWYSVTGKKSLFIQTSVSDVSVSQWRNDGEPFKMLQKKYDYFVELFNKEQSKYTINKTFCIWLQGEWDIAHGMSADEYITHFTNFYEGIKTTVNPDMIGIVPVRSSLDNSEESTLLNPVISAQYRLSNKYNDLKIITRLPETSTVDNGLIGKDNLYYTQKGYNELGKDIAYNISSSFDITTDNSPRSVNVCGYNFESLCKYGETITIGKNEELQTVVTVTPLYADMSEVKVTYDEKLIKYSSSGVITRARENSSLETAEICFECGEIQFKFNIAFEDNKNDDLLKPFECLWEFDNLNSADNSNELTLSQNSRQDGYLLQDGKLISNDRTVDFLLQYKAVLTDETNWEIAWNGSINDNGIILGGNFSTKGYIYLAPFEKKYGNSVRMVDDYGQTFYLAYGEYIESNRVENNWRIVYEKNSKKMTLYLNDVAVSTAKSEKPFKFSFTNIFGRYGSDTINYCYTGTLNFLRIKRG